MLLRDLELFLLVMRTIRLLLEELLLSKMNLMLRSLETVQALKYLFQLLIYATLRSLRRKKEYLSISLN